MKVTLDDKRCIVVPLSWFRVLEDACLNQRKDVLIENQGTSLFWPQLQERILVSGLMAGPKTVDKEKALEATVSYAQSLTQWALLMIGGTALILVSTEYYRPIHIWLLYAYFLFIPGWLFLIISMYKGVRLHQVYLGHLLSPRASWDQSLASLNAHARAQIKCMFIAVAIFGLWLIAYLVYWILFYQPKEVH